MSVLFGSKTNVGWAFSPTILNLGGWKQVKKVNFKTDEKGLLMDFEFIKTAPSPHPST